MFFCYLFDPAPSVTACHMFHYAPEKNMSQWLQSPMCVASKVACSVKINFIRVHYQHVISLIVS